MIESGGYCSINMPGRAIVYTLVGVSLLLLLLGFVLVIQARNVPTEFNEGKYISIAITNNLQTHTIAVALSFFIFNEPVGIFIVKWIAVLSCHAGSLFLIFVPKIITLNQARLATAVLNLPSTRSIESLKSSDPSVIVIEEELREEVSELRLALMRQRDVNEMLRACLDKHGVPELDESTIEPCSPHTTAQSQRSCGAKL